MRARETFFALVSGLVFGIGLIVSGMTSPQKVSSFLDLAGDWDPSLGLVMGGAIGIGLFAFAIARRRSTTLLGGPMRLPNKRTIDVRLVVGSMLFGIGWGIAGLCPGPAIVALGAGNGTALLFVAAMLGGMSLVDVLERAREGRDPNASAAPTTAE